MVARLVRLILVAGLAIVAGCSSAPKMESGISSHNDPVLAGSVAEPLWEKAVEARDQGDLAAASRLLERAVTLEPESSWLYRELAELRLRQGDPGAAEGLARKALRLAPANGAYRAALWQLVGTACLRQANQECASRARKEAELALKQ